MKCFENDLLWTQKSKHIAFTVMFVSATLHAKQILISWTP